MRGWEEVVGCASSGQLVPMRRVATSSNGRALRNTSFGEHARRPPMATGTVKRVVADRGFGFIAADDEKEYFFHRSGLEAGTEFESLNGGETVEFDVEESPKGPRAVHVKKA
jgi:CspA family cold shock protein